MKRVVEELDSKGEFILASSLRRIMGYDLKPRKGFKKGPVKKGGLLPKVKKFERNLKKAAKKTLSQWVKKGKFDADMFAKQYDDEFDGDAMVFLKTKGIDVGDIVTTTKSGVGDYLSELLWDVADKEYDVDIDELLQ